MAIRIKPNKRQVASFILASLLLALNFTMHYGVWKQVRGYNLDKTRYEKLALAYHLGGDTGINYELNNLAKHDPSAADFVSRTSAEIREAKDVRQFIRSSMAADRDKINHLKKNRLILSGVIYFVLACQVLLNARHWWKDNRHHFQKAVQ